MKGKLKYAIPNEGDIFSFLFSKRTYLQTDKKFFDAVSLLKMQKFSSILGKSDVQSCKNCLKRAPFCF